MGRSKARSKRDLQIFAELRLPSAERQGQPILVENEFQRSLIKLEELLELRCRCLSGRRAMLSEQPRSWPAQVG